MFRFRHWAEFNSASLNLSVETKTNSTKDYLFESTRPVLIFPQIVTSESYVCLYNNGLSKCRYLFHIYISQNNWNVEIHNVNVFLFLAWYSMGRNLNGRNECLLWKLRSARCIMPLLIQSAEGVVRKTGASEGSAGGGGWKRNLS